MGMEAHNTDYIQHSIRFNLHSRLALIYTLLYCCSRLIKLGGAQTAMYILRKAVIYSSTVMSTMRFFVPAPSMTNRPSNRSPAAIVSRLSDTT